VTREFEPLARAVAADAGRPSLRVLVLPYPLDTLPEEEVRQIAQEHVGPLLRSLGVRA
jgi:hypothetical protein